MPPIKGVKRPRQGRSCGGAQVSGLRIIIGATQACPASIAKEFENGMKDALAPISTTCLCLAQCAFQAVLSKAIISSHM